MNQPPVFKCRTCGKECVDAKALVQHRQAAHRPPRTKEQNAEEKLLDEIFGKHGYDASYDDAGG